MKVKSYMKYAPHQELTLIGRRYANKRLAIRAVNRDGEPLATLTVNLPEIELAPGEIIIKDWSENEGALETLDRAGLIVKVQEVPTGFCTAHVCKWLGGEL
jgi:hypothetical protein